MRATGEVMGKEESDGQIWRTKGGLSRSFRINRYRVKVEGQTRLGRDLLSSLQLASDVISQAKRGAMATNILIWSAPHISRL
jgi:hypothetical protein